MKGYTKVEAITKDMKLEKIYFLDGEMHRTDSAIQALSALESDNLYIKEKPDYIEGAYYKCSDSKLIGEGNYFHGIRTYKNGRFFDGNDQMGANYSNVELLTIKDLMIPHDGTNKSPVDEDDLVLINRNHIIVRSCQIDWSEVESYAIIGG